MPQALNKKVRDILEDTYKSGYSGQGGKRGKKVADKGLDYEVPDSPDQVAREIEKLEKKMLEHAKNLEFEQAAKLRDQIGVLRERFIALS